MAPYSLESLHHQRQLLIHGAAGRKPAMQIIRLLAIVPSLKRESNTVRASRHGAIRYV